MDSASVPPAFSISQWALNSWLLKKWNQQGSALDDHYVFII